MKTTRETEAQLDDLFETFEMSIADGDFAEAEEVIMTICQLSGEMPLELVARLKTAKEGK